MAREKTICESCGKRRAGGGMRYCLRCYGYMLSGPPAPLPRPRESSITYPTATQRRVGKL